MHGLFLIQGFDSPSSRYRVLQYLPTFERSGIRCHVQSIPDTFSQRFRLIQSLGQYDFVFLQRKRFGPFLTWLLRNRSKVLIFDFDDAIMYRSRTRPNQQVSENRNRQFSRAVRSADLVFCGNRFLFDHSVPHNAHSHIVPTTVDMDRYPLKTYSPRERVTLGWIGSKGTLHYLQALSPVLEEIGRCRDDVQLKIVCNSFFDLEHLPVVKVPWQAETEVAEVQSFDIGLMPLGTDVWSQGKCGLKILQCLAAGVPVVATPAGVNAELVENDATGRQATTDEEWTTQLLALIDDPVGRERMGRLGRQRVMDGYSLQAIGPQIVESIKNLVEQEPSRAAP